MSDQSMHLDKWIPAPEQVTVMHLVKWPHQLNWSISYFDWRDLSKWDASALSQVISHNVYVFLPGRVHFFIPPSQGAFLISVIIGSTLFATFRGNVLTYMYIYMIYVRNVNEVPSVGLRY